MAEIVQSLFGVTPDMYQQAQSQRGDAMALRYAQLDPFQQANYAVGRGAYGLAGAVGGLLGGQDPELQRITARQQIASQINPNDPASIQQGIMALQQAGDTQGAMMLQSEFQKMQESRALIGQREAASIASLAQAGRERTQATAKEIQIASEYASTFGEKGSQEYIDAYRASLRGKEKKDKPIVVGNELVNPVTGAVIYQSPNKTLKTAVVGGNLVDVDTGRVIFTAPETQVKPVVVDNKLVNPVDGTVIYESPSKKLNTAVVSGNLVDVDTGAVIFKAPDKVTPEPNTPELINSRAVALRSGPAGSPEYNAAFDAEYKRLTAEKESKETKTEIQKLQEYAATLKRGSPEFAQVQAKIKALGESGGTKVEVKNVIPGVAPVFDTAGMRAKVQDTIKSQIATISSTEQALQSIDDAIRTDNFVSFNAARTQLAKSLGDTQLSRRDIEQAGGDPSILGGLIDLTSKAFTSLPSIDTQKKIQSTLRAIQKVAQKQAKAEIDAQYNIAVESPGANPAAIKRALNFPQLQAGAAPGAPKATKRFNPATGKIEAITGN